jgi:hypothetical protein
LLTGGSAPYPIKKFLFTNVIKGHRSVLPETDDAARSRASNDANLEERHTGTVVGRRREQGL